MYFYIENCLLEIMSYDTVYQKDKKDCCRGGALRDTDPNIAEKIAQKRIVELRNEAEFIVTACPTCTLAFNGCEVYDISEIVIKSLEKKNER